MLHEKAVLDRIDQAIEQLALDNYVGFWPRVLASLIDTLAVMLVVVPTMIAVYGVAALQGSGEQFAVLGIWDVMINYVFPTIAVLAFWYYFAATPGKMLVNASIVDADTLGKASNKQLLIRYLGYFVSSLPLGLGFFWIAFDKRKQGWHDKMANTVVIRSRN